MKKYLIGLFLVYGLQGNLYSQKIITPIDSIASFGSSLNTYIYTFDEYFYPYGVSVNSNSCYYNPYRQFDLFCPKPDTTDTGNSRFNLININYSPCETFPGMGLYYDGPESGPGLYATGSVRLSIKDSTDNSGGTTGSRSRVELCYFPKHFNGSIYTADVENEIYYYRWDFFIPNDTAFVDEEVPNGWHVISQFHQKNRKIEFDSITGVQIWETDTISLIQGDQPPLYINYIHEENASDNLRDIRFIYGYRNQIIPNGLNARASYFTLENGIKRGEWNKIILKIKWSPVDTIGYMKVWVNDQPVPNDPSQINNKPQNPNYQTTNPYIIYGQNMLTTTQGDATPNYLKMGHYRGKLNSPATIYFDNLIITQDSLTAFKNISASFCGKKLTTNDMKLSTSPVLGNPLYIFKLENTNDPSNIVWQTAYNSTVYLGNNPKLKNKATYIVKVAIDGHSTFEEYGGPCEIYTDYLLELIPSDCGKTLTNNDMKLSTNPIPGNHLYVFKLVNINNPSDIVWQKYYSPSVYLGYNPNLKSNTTYNVSVKIKNHPVFGNYGDICTIHTGNIKLSLMGGKASDEISMLTIYPNPKKKNKTTTILFKVTNSTQPSKIYMLNQRGILQKRIVNQVLNEGTQKRIIETSDLKEGLYFFIFENGVEKTVKKFIVE